MIKEVLNLVFCTESKKGNDFMAPRQLGGLKAVVFVSSLSQSLLHSGFWRNVAESIMSD